MYDLYSLREPPRRRHVEGNIRTIIERENSRKIRPEPVTEDKGKQTSGFRARPTAFGKSARERERKVGGGGSYREREKERRCCLAFGFNFFFFPHPHPLVKTEKRASLFVRRLLGGWVG